MNVTLKRSNTVIILLFSISILLLLNLLYLTNFFEYFNPAIIHRKTYKSKIFCIILTTEKNLKTKAKVTYETWASKCNNYRFISTIPSSPQILKKQNINITTNIFNKSIEANVDNQLKVLQPADFERDSYENLTSKVYLAIKDVFKRFNNYDWYLKADDDTFIFMDNLREFLDDKDPSVPTTYGYDLDEYVENGYHSGGAGYVLSKEAFTRLGSKLNENIKFCPDSGTEDVDVALCLRKLKVYPNMSIDEKGLERFHFANVMDHIIGDFSQWKGMYPKNPVQKGLNCCSDSTISFHYMSMYDMIKISLSINKLKLKSAKILKNSNSNKMKFHELLIEYLA